VIWLGDKLVGCARAALQRPAASPAIVLKSAMNGAARSSTSAWENRVGDAIGERSLRLSLLALFEQGGAACRPWANARTLLCLT
jgi:hypothetical protein